MTVVLPPAAVPVPLSAHDVQDVVDNLIDNVFAHTPEGAPIRIAVDPDLPRAVTLIVEDGGPGLRRAELIARGHSGSGSTGLGLAIVSRIIESVDGDFAVGGSTLGGLAATMRIPVVSER